jgi:hypothetical protein
LGGNRPSFFIFNSFLLISLLFPFLVIYPSESLYFLIFTRKINVFLGLGPVITVSGSLSDPIPQTLVCPDGYVLRQCYCENVTTGFVSFFFPPLYYFNISFTLFYCKYLPLCRVLDPRTQFCFCLPLLPSFSLFLYLSNILISVPSEPIFIINVG